MDNWIGVAVALGLGALFIIIGLPLMLNRVGPNAFYGYRTPATMNNPDIWYPVNALTGKYLAITGGAVILLGLIGLAALNDPRQQEMLVWASLGVLVIGVSWSAYRGHLLSKELSRLP